MCFSVCHVQTLSVNKGFISIQKKSLNLNVCANTRQQLQRRNNKHDKYCGSSQQEASKAEIHVGADGKILIFADGIQCLVKHFTSLLGLLCDRSFLAFEKDI